MDNFSVFESSKGFYKYMRYSNLFMSHNVTDVFNHPSDKTITTENLIWDPVAQKSHQFEHFTIIRR